jgi:uridine phosphorylase
MLSMLEKVATDLSEDEPIFAPKDFIRYEARRRNVDEEHFRVPKRLIVCYEKEAFEYAKQALNGKIIDWFYGESHPFCVGTADGKDIGVFKTAVGAPAAVAMLEELIACGAETMFEVGISGGLQSFLKPGDTVVVTEAVRDEGTSGHYLPPEVRLESSAKLRELLVQQLTTDGIEHKTGPVWTTDGVYRETRGKFLKFSGQGVLAVNMETSALFAVAKYRNVEIASAQVISDVLSTEGWFPAFRHQTVSSSLKRLLASTAKALAKT